MTRVLYLRHVKIGKNTWWDLMRHTARLIWLEWWRMQSCIVIKMMLRWKWTQTRAVLTLFRSISKTKMRTLPSKILEHHWRKKFSIWLKRKLSLSRLMINWLETAVSVTILLKSKPQKEKLNHPAHNMQDLLNITSEMMMPSTVT